MSDTYRPALDQDTKKELEKVKEELYIIEEKSDEYKDKELSNLEWRRNDQTFSVNWILQEALKHYRKEKEI